MSIRSTGGFSPMARHIPEVCSPKGQSTGEEDDIFADVNGLRAIGDMSPQSPSRSVEHQISVQARAGQVKKDSVSPPPPSYQQATAAPAPSAPVAPADDNDQARPAGKMTRFGRYCMGKLHAAWDKLCDGIVYVADKLGTACEKGRAACAASFGKHSGARAGLAGVGVLCFLGTRALCGGVKYATMGTKWFVPKATEFLVFTAVPKTVSFIYHVCRMAGKGTVSVGSVGTK
ncbi:MAG: hypothetical protein ACOYKZ_07455 [Chlamydiia bacterium]